MEIFQAVQIIRNAKTGQTSRMPEQITTGLQWSVSSDNIENALDSIIYLWNEDSAKFTWSEGCFVNEIGTGLDLVTATNGKSNL